MKIHRKHIGKTIVVHNATSWMEYRVVCHTIRFLSYEVRWGWMELDGKRSGYEPLNQVCSLDV